MHKRLSAALCLSLAAQTLLAHTLDESKTKPVKALSSKVAIKKNPEYGTESCHLLSGGKTVAIQYMSAYPVSFHMHFHDDTGVHIPYQMKGEKHKHRFKFKPEETRIYCLTWKNNQLRSAGWNIDFLLKTL